MSVASHSTKFCSYGSFRNNKGAEARLEHLKKTNPNINFSIKRRTFIGKETVRFCVRSVSRKGSKRNSQETMYIKWKIKRDPAISS